MPPLPYKNFSVQLYILLSIVLIAFIGITLSTPILAPLFLNPAENTLVSVSWSHTTRSLIFGSVIAVYPLGQFLGAPLLGFISDQYGRKPTLIVSLLGAGFGYMLTAIALYNNLLVLFFISRFVTGFLEGNVAIVQASLSELGGEDKYRLFGKVSAAATMGRILGPLIGGFFSTKVMVSWFNFYVPFFIGTIALFTIAIIAMIYLKETLPADNRIKSNSIKKYKIFSNMNSLAKDHSGKLKNLFIIWFFVILATDAFDQLLPVFLVGKWQMLPLTISFFIIALSIWYVIGSIWLVPYLAEKIGITTAITLGLLIYGLSLLIMLTFDKSYFLFPIFVFCDLALSAVLVNFYVLASNTAKEVHQGEVMGIFSGIRTLGDTLVGLIGGIIIAISIELPVLLSGLLSILISFYLFKYHLNFLQEEPKPAVLEWDSNQKPLG